MERLARVYSRLAFSAPRVNVAIFLSNATFISLGANGEEEESGDGGAHGGAREMDDVRLRTSTRRLANAISGLRKVLNFRYR